MAGAPKLHHSHQDPAKSKPVKLEKLLSFMTPADKKPSHIPPDLQRLPSNGNPKVFLKPDGSNMELLPKMGVNSNEQPLPATEEKVVDQQKAKEVNTQPLDSAVAKIPETDSGNAAPAQKKRRRQHVRKGRVLDLHTSETEHKEQPHASHLHAETTTLSTTGTTEEASATTAPSNRQQTGVTEAYNSSADTRQENDKGRRPKLFGVADRRPKDFKSQRSRRRKTTTTSSTTTTTTTLSPTTVRSRVESIRIDNQGSPSTRNAE